MPNRRQAIPVEQRYTIQDFLTQFPDDEACLEYVMQKRWPGESAKCVKCSRVLKHYRVANRTCWACQGCGNHLFPLAGTIFHKTTTPLRLWFYTIYLMSATRCGISAKQIQRETGVTYKTAWRMMKQIRVLMAEQVVTTGGPVEIDEAYFGGADKNKHQHLRGRASKTAVLGIVDRRRNRVIARVIPNAQQETILPIVAGIVAPRSTVITDGHKAYEGVRWMGKRHRHKVVNHAAGVYVDGWAHTNTIEGFWGLVKRGISGVYHQVGLRYLQSYLNEYAFRYNRRKVLRPMFNQLIERSDVPVLLAARERRLLQG